ncbi:MAG: hypothetical protein M3042_12575 [Actinomycetota bacterium]|nr:hypothetical protein [Actinomycetota bacterium]
MVRKGNRDRIRRTTKEQSADASRSFPAAPVMGAVGFALLGARFLRRRRKQS